MNWLRRWMDLWKGPSVIPAHSPSPRPVPAPDPESILVAINARRSDCGARPVAEDPSVSIVSQSWAARMVATGLTHGDFAGRITSVHPGIAAGEDIGWGYSSAEAEVDAWFSDPPHRAILIDPRWTHVGVGTAADKQGQRYFVADFVELR